MICSGRYYFVACQWTEFVAGTGFWISGTLLIFYFCHVMEHFNGIPWMKIEMGICGLWTMFFFASGIALAVKIRYSLAQPLKILKINNLKKKQKKNFFEIFF
jgi:hypothetical protein